ncbi:Integrase, catalytic core [Gossypium australe]|uniref:Integrase, catalytic core n=1 Tax=Gossypium australe TaxID=47621 RepID=A0A5B6UVE5_9ROSI|nr:Integrase, catalytic core [Gossypium australe]
MLLKGLSGIKLCEVIVLVNLRSTYNFVDHKLTKRLNLLVEPSCQLKVMIVVGGSLATQGVCKSVLRESQGHQFETNFLVLSVKGCDLVLGIQWLMSLGSIMWDFATLTMLFEYRD